MKGSRGSAPHSPITYQTVDEPPSPSLKRLVVLGLIGMTILLIFYLLWNMPGEILIGGNTAWSSDQTWIAAFSILCPSTAALLVYLR